MAAILPRPRPLPRVTFAGLEQPRHPTDPHRDLDLASYGVVAVLEHARGTTYPDMAWEPKQVFGALAAAYARARGSS
jgi:hypothetical protein